LHINIAPVSENLINESTIEENSLPKLGKGGKDIMWQPVRQVIP